MLTRAHGIFVYTIKHKIIQLNLKIKQNNTRTKSPRKKSIRRREKTLPSLPNPTIAHRKSREGGRGRSSRPTSRRRALKGQGIHCS